MTMNSLLIIELKEGAVSGLNVKQQGGGEERT